MFGKEHRVERRLHPRRLLVNPPIFVSIGESRTALLFDLGEGGLSVYGLVPKRRDEVFPVTFDLPVGGGSIKASAEIAWASTTKDRTGIRFVDVADASRQRLADWMGNRFYLAQATTFDGKPADPLSPARGSYATLVSQEREEDGLAVRSGPLATLRQPTWELKPPKLALGDLHHPRRAGKPRLAIEILLSMALLSLAFGFLHSYRSKMIQAGKVREITVTPPGSSSKGSAAPENAESAAAPPQPTTSSLDVPGFFLQVGAMKSEDNADELSNSLKRKSFPVFVFKRSTDRFYRVAVGPYADLSSAKRVRNELQRENVEAILRRWVPE